MAQNGSITIKELHAKTGEYVRRAGRARIPLPVTDRGKVVAALVPPTLPTRRRRQRTLLPEYVTFLARRKASDILEGLDTVRSDR
jgi:prevent-host-death family protein